MKLKDLNFEEKNYWGALYILNKAAHGSTLDLSTIIQNIYNSGNYKYFLASAQLLAMNMNSNADFIFIIEKYSIPFDWDKLSKINKEILKEEAFALFKSLKEYKEKNKTDYKDAFFKFLK